MTIWLGLIALILTVGGGMLLAVTHKTPARTVHRTRSTAHLAPMATVTTPAAHHTPSMADWEDTGRRLGALPTTPAPEEPLPAATGDRPPRSRPDYDTIESTPRGVNTATVGTLPATVCKDVTLELWRDQAIEAQLEAHDLTVELVETRRSLEALKRQLWLSPRTDDLVIWLDVHGGEADISQAMRELRMDRGATVDHIAALAARTHPIALDGDRVRLNPRTLKGTPCANSSDA